MIKFTSSSKVTLFGRKRYKFQQKVVAFLFFLVLATIFWLLNSLDNTFSTNITYPIRYIHYRPDKEMVGDIPKALTLNVTGHGYVLLRNILTSKNHPIIFRVIALKFDQTTSDSGKFFLTTRVLKENIQRQIGEELTLNYVTPDSLLYTFSPVVRKKVPIEANLELDFSKQYMQEGRLIYQPDSIIVSGPASIIDTLSFIHTEKDKATNINKSFSKMLQLIKIANVDFAATQVNITVPVEKYTESTIKIPIKSINVPDSIKLKTFPSHISIIYLVSLRNYNKISSSQFRVVVDYFNTSSTINNKLKVKIERYPAMIKLVNYSPKNVEYLIEK